MTIKNPLGKDTIFKQTKVHSHWFYMNQEHLTTTDIKSAVASLPSIQTEHWQDADILEILLTEKSSIDFEPMEAYFKDDADNQFLIDHNIKSLYYVTCNPEHFDHISKIFESIIQINSGMFCADTSDFLPRIE